MIEPMEINLQSMQDIIDNVASDYKKALNLLTELVNNQNDPIALSFIWLRVKQFLKENGRKV